MADRSAAAPGGADWFRSPWVWAAALVAAATAWAYAPNFAWLAGQWWGDPNYSHGFLVIPIAVAVLRHRRDRVDLSRLAPSAWGWAALLLVLALRAWLFERNEQWVETATIPLAVAALVLAFGGRWLLLWALPAVAFLWLMVPMPPSLNAVLAAPLQRLATLGSTSLLQLFGLPVLAEGNVIRIGPHELEVAQACNGLSMIQAFITLIVATVLLVDRPVWEKAVLLASTVPIALVSNVLRIAATAWAYHRFRPGAVLFGDWTLEKVAHDTAGWAMMPIALALVWVELRALEWLVVEEEVDERPAAPVVRPVVTALPMKAPQKAR